jgi:hypothetical protein
MTRASRLCCLLLLPLLVPGCASMGRMGTSMGKWFEKTYCPRLGEWTLEDVQDQEAADEKRKPVVAVSYSTARDLTLLTYTWGDFEGKNIQKTKYYAGSFLYPASSETESVLVRDGVRDAFAFDGKGRLRWCKTLYYNDGELMDEGGCGDAKFQPAADEKFSGTPVEREDKGGAKTLEQRLEDLKQLKAKGVITDAEYKKMRAKALEGF